MSSQNILEGQKSALQEGSRERFVLIETSHAGNVGATARAMKVMGFSDLVLVRPRDPRVLGRQETIARASGALDILKNARIVDSVDEALEGMSFVCSTAMTPRDFGPDVQTPRVAFEPLAKTKHTVAFLFGCERYGMTNEDVYKSHLVLSIPTNPDYGSLNLASAVQLLAYEWRMALGGFDVIPRTVDAELASAQAVQGMLEHLEKALVHIDFLDPVAPKKLMPRLNQLFNRAELTQEEVHLLRGMARTMLRVGVNSEKR
ncbi:MAG: RNA methyltransferase [Saezia sp.]